MEGNYGGGHNNGDPGGCFVDPSHVPAGCSGSAGCGWGGLEGGEWWVKVVGVEMRVVKEAKVIKVVRRRGLVEGWSGFVVEWLMAARG